MLVVNHIVGNLVAAVDQMRQTKEFANLEIIVITDRPDFSDKYSRHIRVEQIIHCDFQDEKDIADKLAPFRQNICGVICRGDRHIQYLRKIVPFLPPQVLAATPESLANSTNKRLMRTSFAKHYPEITPKFLQVLDDSAETLKAIEAQMPYPLIIKPANLFSSLLIQVCNNRAQLKQALGEVFREIRKTYRLRDIHESPQVIIEDYLEGDFYSIDAYAMELGEIYFCPPVSYVPASQIGIDDFSLYKRFIPTRLSDTQIEEANQAVRKALVAVGLTHSTAHVELVLTAQGWKIIEIGPRLGRFRFLMYKLGYGIDHSLNDLKIHLGIKPDIPETLLQHCSAYSIYATQEGILKKIYGIEFLKGLPELKSLKLYSEKGDDCRFAKHGGHAILEFVVACKSLKRFKELTQRIERGVYADID